MKRLIALGLGAFGLRALLRRRRSRSTQADELREKLAATRAAEPATPVVAVEEPAPEPEPAPAASTQAADPEPAPPPEPDSVDERRAEVHARARQKIDELS